MRGRPQRAILGLFLVACVTLASSAGLAESRLAANAERPSTPTLTDALVRVLDARLSLAQWRLDKLTKLHAQGFASWRECAEQRAAIEAGECQRQAVADFAAYLRAVDEQTPRVDTTENAVAAAHRQEPVVKLTLPGSVRLVAWIEADEAPGTLADLPRQSANPSEPQDNVRQLQQQVAAAEKRVAGLARIAGRPDVTEEARREEMALAVTRAELHFAQLCSQVETIVRPEAGEVRNTAMTAGTAIAANETSPQLRQAALRVATAEAQASGAMRMAEIGAQRAALLVDSFQQLQARGFASAREVQNAEQESSAAKAVVEQRRAQQARQVQAFELLRVKQQDDQQDSGEVEVQATALPRELLNHHPAVEHLIALRLQRCLAAVHQTTAAAKLNLLEALDRRLSNRTAGAGQHTRENEFAALDIAYSRAEVLAATERCEALRLEERRFVEQFRLSSPVVARRVAYVDDSLRESESNSRSELATMVSWPYSESVSDGLSLLASNVFSAATPSSIAPSSRNYVGSTASGTSPNLVAPSSATYYPFDRPPPKPSLFRVPVYDDYYQFGNLRPDLPTLENRATSYGGPWFYPGASTNFR